MTVKARVRLGNQRRNFGNKKRLLTIQTPKDYKANNSVFEKLKYTV